MKVEKYGRVLFFAFLVVSSIFFLTSCKKKRDVFAQDYVKAMGPLSDDAFGLVITTSMEGYVEPCGCTRDPLGGIARFATVVSDIKTALKNNLALIDGGNLLFDMPTRIEADRCQDEKRIEVLLTTLSSLGLTTTVTGALDDARGEAFRNQTYKKFGLGAMSSVLASKNPLDAVHKIKTPSGIIAVLAHSQSQEFDSALMSAFLAELKKSGDVKAVIMLSQDSPERTKELFRDQTNIDIVVQALITTEKPLAPQRLSAHGPWLVFGGRQGQYFSILLMQNLIKRKSEALILDERHTERAGREALLTARIEALMMQAKDASKDRKDFLLTMIERAKSEIAALAKTPLPSLLSEPHVIFHQFPITKKIDSEPKAKDRLEDYEKAIPALVKKCEANLVCEQAGPNDATYVGAQTCKNCHQEAFDVWTKSIYASIGTDDDGNEIQRSVGHSKAWKTLVEAEKDADRSCVGCHSIGFMKKGGYCRALEVDFRVDVQCESCHGAGSLHAASGDKQFINRKVSEETCRECHQVPHIPSYESFNYNEKVIKILGKGHGENLLKELQHRAKN